MPVNLQPPPNPFLPYMYYRGGQAAGKMAQGAAIERRQAAERQMVSQAFGQIAQFGSNLFMSTLGQQNALQLQSVGHAQALELAGVQNTAAAQRVDTYAANQRANFEFEYGLRQQAAVDTETREQAALLDQQMRDMGISGPITVADQFGYPQVVSPLQQLQAVNRQRQQQQFETVQSQNAARLKAANMELGVSEKTKAEIAKTAVAIQRTAGDPTIPPSTRAELLGGLNQRMDWLARQRSPVPKQAMSAQEVQQAFQARTIRLPNGYTATPEEIDGVRYRFMQEPQAKSEKAAANWDVSQPFEMQYAPMSTEAKEKMYERLYTVNAPIQTNSLDAELAAMRSVRYFQAESRIDAQASYNAAVDAAKRDQRQQQALQKARAQAQQMFSHIPGLADQQTPNLYAQERAAQEVNPDIPKTIGDVQQRLLEVRDMLRSGIRTPELEREAAALLARYYELGGQ